MHIYGVENNGPNKPICKEEWRRRHREQTCGHSGVRRGRDALRE